MGANWLKRPCRFCRTWFEPDVRLGDRQVACSATQCQKRRKAAAQAAWMATHPGYFRGRTEKHRQWRRAHPDAQRRRRAASPALRERERLDRAKRRRQAESRRAVEQDAIALKLVAGAAQDGQVPRAVEQDAIRAGILVVVGVASRLPPAVEQGPIAGALRTWHDRGRRLVGGRRAKACAP